MQWILIQTPEGPMCAWSLAVRDRGMKLPPRSELEVLVRRHVPTAVIESYSEVRATVLLPADTDIDRRSIIANDVRTRAQALA